MPKETSLPTDNQDFRKKYLGMATVDFANSLIALLRTRTKVIYISSSDEKRLLEYLDSVSKDRGYQAFEWDCFKLLRSLGKKAPLQTNSTLDLRYPEQILAFIIEELENEEKKKIEGNGSIFILCDFYRYLSPDRCNPQIERQIKYLNRLVSNSHVIFTGPSFIGNPALEKEVAILDFPFPNEQEIKSVLHSLTSADKVIASMPTISKIINKQEEELVNAVKGLTLTEANQAYSKSIVMANQLGLKPLDIGMILQEKKQIIKKTDVLEYVDSQVNMNDVGGLDNLARWMNIRRVSFSKDAASYGLKPPKGVLLLGLPGCGKSLTAKAASTMYEMPLLRLDFGKMFNSLVGESEKIARHAIKLSETIAPCVSGDSIVYDHEGKSFKIKDLIDAGNGDKPMYIYALNEKTWKIEKTKVKAVIKHARKKSMLKITTSAGSIEVTRNHKMMVNRDGDLIWVEASKLAANDALVMPKYLKRDVKSFQIQELFPTAKGTKVVSRVGGNLHCADISVPMTSLEGVATIAGMIDSNGNCNTETGDILFSSNNSSTRHIFAFYMSQTFLTEPEIGDSFVRLKNKVVAEAINAFLRDLGSQDMDALQSYLGGFFHAGGQIGFVDRDEETPRKPYVSFPIQTEASFDRLRKSLLVYGIIASKSLRTAIILDPLFIRTLLAELPYLSKTSVTSVAGFMNHIELNRPLLIDMVGYKFGKSLAYLKSNFGVTESKYSQICGFEEDAVMMQHGAASMLNMFLKKKFKSDSSCPITKLVESDVISVKIQKIESVGMQFAYDLSCEGNNNFFANGFLCHNCILWADEIEKGLAGGVGAGSGDSGTTKRVIGTFLTWLQEKTAPVFVICTANNVQDIPPEFMRAGRFDEVFFVDLAGEAGRRQIFDVLLKRFKHDSSEFNLDALAAHTKGFSGAEIEKAIEDSMFECFCDGKRKITSKDILKSCSTISPLSKTRDKEFEQMREWAKGRCKFANTIEEASESNLKKDAINLDLSS